MKNGQISIRLINTANENQKLNKSGKITNVFGKFDIKSIFLFKIKRVWCGEANESLKNHYLDSIFLA